MDPRILNQGNMSPILADVDPFDGTLTERLTNGTLSDITLGDAVKIASLSAADPSVVTFELGAEQTTNGDMSGIALGADLLSGWDFTSGWALINAGTIDDANSFTTVSTGGVVTDTGLLTIGKCYKIVQAGSTTASSYRTQSNAGTFRQYGVGDGTFYFCAESTELYIRNQSAGTTDITTLTIEEVTLDNFTVGNVDADNYFIYDGSTVRIVSDNTAAVNLYQNVTVVAGTMQQFSLDISSYAAGDVRLRVHDITNNVAILSVTSMGWGSNGTKTYCFKVPPTCTTVKITIYRDNSGNTDYEFTNWSLKPFAGTLSEGDGIQIAGLSDAEMLDPSLITGTDSDMSGANNWANLGLNAMDVNSTVAGKLYMESSVAGGFALIADALAGATGYVKLKLKARLKAGVSTPLNIGLADGFDIVCSFPITPTGSELEYEGVCKIDGGTTVFIQIDTTTAGIQFEIDDFTAEPYSIINGEIFELTNFSTTAPTAEIDVDLSNKSGATGECFARLATFDNFTVGDGVIPYVEVNPESLITNGGMEFDRDWSNIGTPVTEERSAVQAWKDTYSRHIVNGAGVGTDGNVSVVFAATEGVSYFVQACFYVVSGDSRYRDNAGRIDFELIPISSGKWELLSGVYEATGSGDERVQIVSQFNLATEFYADEVQVYNIVAFGARWTGSQSAESSLEQDVSAESGNGYKITTNIDGRTAGTVTPAVGGASGVALSEDETANEQNIEAVNTNNCKWKGNSTFEGKVLAIIKCEEYVD